jgi:hypothetical protein
MAVALVNLISNGIEYNDPAKEDRRARIGADLNTGGRRDPFVRAGDF